MRGFIWGFLAAATMLVALMWTGVLNVRYSSAQASVAQPRVIRSVTLAQADNTNGKATALPEIRVLDKNEGR